MDPMTIAALIKGGTALAQGIAGGIGAKKQAEAEKARAQAMEAMAEKVKGGAFERRSQYGLGPSYNDLRSLIMQDPASDYLRQQAQRQEAGQMEALQAGGARALLGGTQAVSQSTADRLAQIAGDEQRRKATGLQVVGQAEQRVAEEKLQDARGDLTYGRGLAAEAQAARYGAEDLSRLAKQQMWQTGLEGLGAAGMAAYNQYGNKDKSGNAQGFKGLDPELLRLILG